MVHLCLSKRVFSQTTQAAGQIHVTELLKQSEGAYKHFLLQQQSAIQPPVVSGRDSRTDRIKSQQLGFKSLAQLFSIFQDITYSLSEICIQQSSCQYVKAMGREEEAALPLSTAAFQAIVFFTHQY